MGWGIDFNTDIFISKVNIQSISHCRDIIEDVEQEIIEIHELLKMYAVSRPTDVFDAEIGVINDASNVLSDWLKELNDKTILLYNLGLYLNKLNEEYENTDS